MLWAQRYRWPFRLHWRYGMRYRVARMRFTWTCGRGRRPFAMKSLRKMRSVAQFRCLLAPALMSDCYMDGTARSYVASGSRHRLSISTKIDGVSSPPLDGTTPSRSGTRLFASLRERRAGWERRKRSWEGLVMGEYRLPISSLRGKPSRAAQRIKYRLTSWKQYARGTRAG